MASIPVVVKHQGKKYDVEVDTSSSGEDFKLQMFSLTNVEPERQKILIKGGQLKDNADMGNVGLKAGQIIMMMGTPGSGGAELVRPKDPIKFVEDMTDAEKAQQADATPPGLVNVGNTCYLNSTLQTLHLIPELSQALKDYYPDPSPSALLMGSATGDISAQLAGVFHKMRNTQEPFPPLNFLTSLRLAFPQFGEKDRSGQGYAQQDAEEAWSQIVHQLNTKLRDPDTPDDANTPFVDKYLAGEFTSVVECDEEEAREKGEKAVINKDKFSKLDCHIDSSVNHLRDGIMAGFKEKLEKKSEVLGRDAVYTKTSKISRAPKYLTVHFVRFFWKRDTQKKAKIMRKVTFPHELDITEFCSDELRDVLVPVRDKVREIRKDQEDIERSRKRRKKTRDQEMADVPGGAGLPTEREKELQKKKASEKKGGKSADGDTIMEETYKTDAEVEAEQKNALLQAKLDLRALLNQDVTNDKGANQTGMYELRGVVTHQGASADSGHYTAYVKKSATIDAGTRKKGEEDGNWWWFNDDKVTEVTPDKIDALAGGGESHSALVLLYQAVPLPDSDDIKNL